MFKKLFVRLLILVALWSLGEGVARACSCIGGQPPCQAYGSASAVFVGRVTGVRNNPRVTREEARRAADEGEMWMPRLFKFEVVRPFSGNLGTEVEIGTGMGGGDCGYGFRTGETYLVYAYRYGKSERLGTGICTRTRSISQAGEDLDFLGGLPGREPGVSISGQVVRQLYSVKDGGPTKTTGGLADAALVVEGDGERREVRADAQGRYSVSGLKPGSYKVRLLLPEELFVHSAESDVRVADRGCAVVNYYVTDNGRISGVISDAEGKPAAKILVTLAEADTDPERDHTTSTRTDEEGRYKFSAVPPGRYLLAVNLTKYPEQNDPTGAFPRTYYPGVAQASQAEVVSLGAGENVTGRDLRLPARRAASAVEVQVVWDDGKPLAGAFITYRDVTYHDSGGGYGADADEQGRYTIKGFEGQTFVIEAGSKKGFSGSARGGGPSERAAPVKVTLANPTEPVKFVVRKLH